MIIYSINTNPHFKGKGNHHLSSVGWREVETDLTTLIHQVTTQGIAMMPAIVTHSARRKKDLSKFHLVVVDVDNAEPDSQMTWEEAIENPFLRNNALALWTSTNHKRDDEEEDSDYRGQDRFRILFKLDEPFRFCPAGNDVAYKEFKEIIERLNRIIPGADHNIKPAHYFAGCFDGLNHIYRMGKNVLDFSKVPQLPIIQKPIFERGESEFTGSTDDSIKNLKRFLHHISSEKTDVWMSVGGSLKNIADELNEDDLVRDLFHRWSERDYDGYDFHRVEQFWESTTPGLGGWGNLKQLALESDNPLPQTQSQPTFNTDDFGEIEGFVMRNIMRETTETTINETKTTGQKIQELLDRVVELELDIKRNTWAERQALIKEITSLGPSRHDIKKRIFEHICNYFGVDLGSTKGNTIETKGMDRARKLLGKLQQPYLVPDYLQRNRDAIFYGDSGSGKTTIALDLIRSLIQGRTFADAKEPCPQGKKVLFIASDGGPSAEGVLIDYLNKLGVTGCGKFADKFKWWSGDEESTTPSWNLNLGNLIKLKDEIQGGHYDLVVIDSLKSVTSGTDYSIDDRTISDVMRLVQAIVTPHAALMWIHHTNKSGKTSSHSAGGVTDIIEVVSAAFQVSREWVEGQKSQQSTMKIQKLRGQSTRQFDFEFDWEQGVIPFTEFDSTTRELEARQSAYPEAILVAIRDSPNSRMFRATIADELNANPQVISNHLQDLKQQGLITETKSKGCWKLTKDGEEVSANFTRKRLESITNLSKDF